MDDNKNRDKLLGLLNNPTISNVTIDCNCSCGYCEYCDCTCSEPDACAFCDY